MQQFSKILQNRNKQTLTYWWNERRSSFIRASTMKHWGFVTIWWSDGPSPHHIVPHSQTIHANLAKTAPHIMKLKFWYNSLVHINVKVCKNETGSLHTADHTWSGLTRKTYLKFLADSEFSVHPFISYFRF